MSNLIIGIDPGVKTGFAIWDRNTREFLLVTSLSIVTAMQYVMNFKKDSYEFSIRFEDARQRKWFGKSGREVLQGAGSIKRDCSIWQEFCEYHGFEYQMIAPAKGQTKWDAKTFKKITGWQQRTNEHSRDAAVLVFGM